jgi:hypothetical protein
MGLFDKLRAPKDRGGDSRRKPTINDLARASKFDFAAYNDYGSRYNTPENEDDVFTVNPSRPLTEREKNIKNQNIPSIISTTKPVYKTRAERQAIAKHNAQGQGSYLPGRSYTRPDEENF